ncbi:MAG TPA: glycosyltransferase [Xanthomonadaceae bacterium]|nr:glycosyltransferase [Xanthomonadaceae bacterium]
MTTATPAPASAADIPARPRSVTVLVIAYRMRDTIAQAITSVAAQTMPCEVIVSDDSSGDGTLDAAQAAVDALPAEARARFRVRSTGSNVGLCEHLNELAAVATGDVLVFQAGDDIAYPDRVARLVREFELHDAAMVVGSCVDDIDGNGRLLAPRVRGLPEVVDQQWFLRRGKLQTILGASMAVRREVLASLPPLRGRVEDNMLSLRGALLGECRCIQQPLLGYRRHDHNLNDWMFDRSSRGYQTYERRNRRVLAMYRDIADDQQRCLEALPQMPARRRHLARQLADMYRLEAEMREVVLDQPRRNWLGPLARGLCHPGLRRKSAERALKLLLPRRWFGRG